MIDTALYKQRLEKDLSEVVENLKELGLHNPSVKGDWLALPQDVNTQEADPNVGADRAEDWLERNAILGELEAQYNNITRALGKIEAGTFGVCEIDNVEIEEDRLEANPAARTCKAHIEDEQDLPA
jgi:RNA polymerase-binding transcription factor DksA